MNDKTVNEKKLVNLIKNDPGEGLKQAIDYYGRGVKTICSMILKDFGQEDIEEVMSDSFTQLWRGVQHFDFGRAVSLKSYVYGIAKNLAFNRRRLLLRHMTFKTEELEKMPSEENLETEVTRHLEAMEIIELINQMKSPDKEIFLHRYIDDEKVKTVAEKLNMTEKAVENRLKRGRLKLKKECEKRGIIHE